LIEAGYLTIIISFFTSFYSTILAVNGFLRRDPKYLKNSEEMLYFTVFMITISLSILLYYFITDNFTIEYVYLNSASDLPVLYKISALWAGSEGSLLFWAWILSIFTLLFIYTEKKDLLTAHAVIVLLTFQNFFLLVLMYFLNPFKPLDFIPAHGMGLNPLLETHEMIFHPTTLFAGYASTLIPFSLAISGLNLTDESWVFRARRWILFSWMWLTAGISIGAYWAYKTLGWGGFWAWDPVENASLLPWLTLTALVHSIMIQEARQGMKKWNILLSLATIEFVLLGTLITRSGIIASIHAFGRSGLGIPFTILMVSLLAVTVYLIKIRSAFIKSHDVIEHTISKETTFLLNNLLFTAFALTVFWGTIFPLISEALLGYKATIGAKYYEQTTSPIAYAIIALTGFCVAIGWRRGDKKTVKRLLVILSLLVGAAILAVFAGISLPGSAALAVSLFAVLLQLRQYVVDTGTFNKEYSSLSFIKIILRRRRRYSGYTIHLGVIMVFIGIVGNWMYAEEHEVVMKVDEQIKIGDYSFVYRGYSEDRVSSKIVIESEIDVINDGKIQKVFPKIERYMLQNNEIVRVVIIYEPLRDIYITLVSIEGDSAVLKIKSNPLTSLIWNGSLIMLGGVIFGLIPRRVIVKFLDAKVEKVDRETDGESYKKEVEKG
jgi:cytochrome c-type biogenesis protein CcmF